MSCVWMLQRGHSGDGCHLESTLCMLLGRVIYLFCVGKGCDERGGKYLFRATNVWWRCEQHFVIASCG